MTYANRTKITNSSGVVINPATEESVLLLRKIAKLLESNATVDANQRQRVIADQTTAANLNATVVQATAANLNATVVMGASTVNMGQVVVGFGGQATAAANIIDSRFLLIDTARGAYANGIRSKIS